MDLLDAICRGNLTRVNDAIADGANPNLTDDHRRTPMIRAAEWDRPESVGPLLAAGARLEERDEHGFTALLTAVNAGNPRMVKALIDAGADVNATVRGMIRDTSLSLAFRCSLGFEDRSLETARLVAAAMPDGAVAADLHRRVARQHADLLHERSATAETINEFVAKMENSGIDRLTDGQRDELKKILEAAQAFDKDCAALQERGEALLERIPANPQAAVADAFRYVRGCMATITHAIFVRGSSGMFLFDLER